MTERRAYFVTELVLHVPLNATQHEWLEDHMKTPKLMLVEPASLVFRGVLDVLGEPFVELVMRVEQTRHDEMQQRPQLCDSLERPW